MNQTLYVSDLDGTLLNNQAVLSLFSQQTLRELLEDGLTFTVASARSGVSIQMMLKGLRLPLPIVEFNGAFITDLESGHHEVINRIDSDIIEDVYPLICKFSCVSLISRFNGTADCLYYNDIINDGMYWYIVDRQSTQDRIWLTMNWWYLVITAMTLRCFRLPIARSSLPMPRRN